MATGSKSRKPLAKASQKAPPGRRDGQERGNLKRVVQKIEQNLATAAWEAYGEIFGFRENHGRAFPMELKVIVEPGFPWRLAAEMPIEEQIRDAVRNMVERTEVLRPGRLFCYRCESSECAHSVPPRSTSVFGGYTPTGLPRWPEFPQVLIDLRHPKMDVLYESSRGDLVAAFMEADALKCSQLNVFGRQSNAYNIWGQVVFGYVRVRPFGQEAQEPQKVALTIQVVESRRLDGSPHLELNVLGRLWDGSPAVDALTGPGQWRIPQVIADARQRICSLAPKSRQSRARRSASLGPEAKARSTRVLKDMASKLERLGRQVSRRTTHAEERRVDNRPTSKAWEDAAAAPDEAILWDEHRQTVVVMGSKTRIHVFSPEGRHMTSFILEAEAIKSRLRRKRWNPLTGDALERFSAAVGRVTGAQDHSPARSGGRDR